MTPQPTRPPASDNTYAYNLRELTDPRPLILPQFAPDGESPWWLAPEVVL